MAAPYCPDYGDIIWIDFDPQTGREQAGRRPALVLTDRNYNERTSLLMACPITSKTKGYKFEVYIHAPLHGPGAILINHLRAMDWVRRKIAYIGAAPEQVLIEVRAKLRTLLRLH